RVRSLDYDNVWGDVTWDLVLSDWKQAGPIKCALTRKLELNGRVVKDFTFSELKFNQPPDAKRLAIPAEVRAGAAKPATGNVPYQWVIRRQYIRVVPDSARVSYD